MDRGASRWLPSDGVHANLGRTHDGSVGHDEKFHLAILVKCNRLFADAADIARHRLSSARRFPRGAQTGHILKLVAQDGMRLILTGIAIGLFASYFLTHLLSSQIWAVSETDPSTFAVVASLQASLVF
jgi:hypothetical protein